MANNKSEFITLSESTSKKKHTEGKNSSNQRLDIFEICSIINIVAIVVFIIFGIIQWRTNHRIFSVFTFLFVFPSICNACKAASIAIEIETMIFTSIFGLVLIVIMALFSILGVHPVWKIILWLLGGFIFSITSLLDDLSLNIF